MNAGGRQAQPAQPEKGERRADASQLIEKLTQEAEAYAQAQYAEATKEKNIGTAQRAYEAFCYVTGMWPSTETGITETEMCLFIAMLARSVKYSTITNYISMGVRTFHIKHNLPYIGTETHRIRAALAGVRRTLGDVRLNTKCR